MSHLTITPAIQDDSADVAKLVWKLLAELAPDHAPDLHSVTDTASRVLAMPDVTGFLARQEGKVIGLILLNQCAAIYAGGRFGEISELYVETEHRSTGIARRLVEAAIEDGVRRGWRRLEVGAPPQPAWARTLNFYLGVGFEEVGPRLRKVL